MHDKFLSHEFRVPPELQICDFSIKKNLSIMNILNNSGSNIYPWGIP